MGVVRQNLILLFLLLPAGAALAAEPQEFTVSQASARIPVITAYLDILDAGGQPVTGITPANLSATIGRHAARVAEVKSFEENREGVAYIFLIDVSRSLRPAEFAQMREAIKSWIAGLQDRDRMAILAFGDEVKLVADFTANQDELNAKLTSLGPTDSRTRLHAALARAMEMQQRGDDDLPTRRVIVVLSDGKDEGSGLTAEDVLEKIRQSHMPIYAVGYSSLPGAERQQYQDVLYRFARSSGGVFREAGAARLTEIYTDLKQAIRRVQVARFTCDDCPADGQSYRLQINLTVGNRKLSDGFDMILTPDVATAALPATPPAWWQRAPWWGYALIGLGVIGMAFAVVALAARSRKREDQSASLQGAAVANAPRGLPVRLLAVGGPDAGRAHELSLVERAVIGRRPECDLALAGDDEISGRHCELALVNGHIIVTDLQSKNGTWVNGIPVAGRCRLESGDSILLGGTELRVAFEERL